MTPSARQELPPKRAVPTAGAGGALPPFSRLARIGSIWVSPFVALSLIGGRVWPALSLLAGLALSLAVCGMLYLFVDLGVAHLALPSRGRAADTDGGVKTLQFTLALGVKFLVLAGVGWAVMTLHAIVLPAVLAGFVVAQTAIVWVATRPWTPRPEPPKKDS